jgi:hypothetical protein
VEEHVCGDCGERFGSEEALDAHRAAANHPAMEHADKLECNRCGFLMESQEELDRHIQQMHSAQASA